MKFDVVVGNPPYQENDNGKRENGTVNASSKPVYHFFFQLGLNISNDKVSLIFPARWLTGSGKGLNEFKNNMFNNNHIKSISLFINSISVFDNTDIKGGVLSMIYDKEYHGETDIEIIEKNNNKKKYKGVLDSIGEGVFIRFPELISIYNKVIKINIEFGNNMQKITSVLKPYGLRTDVFLNAQKYKLPDLLVERKAETDIEVMGLIKNKRQFRYVSSDYPIPSGKDNIYTYKVFIPYAYGAGEFGEKMPEPVIGIPGMIATETFLRVGSFNKIKDAENLKKYICTKFFRAMVGILKNTQHSTTTYKFVPIQDFTSHSDIDWGESISEIDGQLYKKYGLDTQEIAFIEDNVRPME